MKKTIGGNRLGSGAKMEVDLRNYGRSTHNLGAIWRSTTSSGTLVPFMSELALPGDTFDIELMCDIMTHPTVGPMLGSYKVQLDVFQIPIRLYIAALHNNKLDIGLKMEEVKLPQIRVAANADIDPSDVSQIHPSCILSYLNIRGVGRPLALTGGTIKRDFNAIPLIGYWDIYKNYYANKQEGIGAVIHSPRNSTTTIESIEVKGTVENPDDYFTLPEDDQAVVTPQHMTSGTFVRINWPSPMTEPAEGTILLRLGLNYYVTPEDMFYVKIVGANETVFSSPKPEFYTAIIYAWAYNNGGQVPDEAPKIQTFDLTEIDDLRQYLQTTTTPVVFDKETTYLPIKYVLDRNGENTTTCSQNQEGLGIKTYQSDLLNNWMRTSWIDGEDGINQITAISTAGNQFTIDALQLGKKVYDMLNRIAISGGTYDDYLETVYDHKVYKRATTPIYLGGLIKELGFQEIISNSASELDGTTQPLGQLAGKGVMGHKHKGGHIIARIDEPSYIMGIFSLTPRVDYSQGNKWDVNLKTIADFHKPALDEIGFQDLITDQMAYWDTEVAITAGAEAGAITYHSAGKQPAWINYMTNINETRGNFAIPDNEMFMTLNRRYEQINGYLGIKDLTTYIDPSKYNYIFAETALDAQNFWVQINKKITARRKMSAKIMPNL